MRLRYLLDPAVREMVLSLESNTEYIAMWPRTCGVSGATCGMSFATTMPPTEYTEWKTNKLSGLKESVDQVV